MSHARRGGATLVRSTGIPESAIMSSCGSPAATIQQALTAYSSDTVYAWFTGWRVCIGLANVDSVLKRRAVTGNFQSRPTIQFAPTRTDNPDAPTLLDSQMRAGAGEAYSTDDVTSAGASKFFYRLGVAYSLSSGTGGRADVDASFVDDKCGGPIGNYAGELTTLSDTTDVIAITAWMPARLAAKIKAALNCVDLTGNFRYRLVYRTAATSTEAPDAWDTAFDTWRSAAGEANTGELTPTITNKMWIQFGIAYGNSSGSALGRASVYAMLAGRKA